MRDHLAFIAVNFTATLAAVILAHGLPARDSLLNLWYHTQAPTGFRRFARNLEG
jgi:hypothetical protein